MKKYIYVIDVFTQQDFVKGDYTDVYLHEQAPDSERPDTICLASHYPTKNFFELSENLAGIKSRLEMLGHEVKVKVVNFPDPNFDSAEEADEFMCKRPSYVRD